MRYNSLRETITGPWHRRNRQMLGVPPIPRGAKGSEVFFFNLFIFLLPILLHYYEFKILQKSVTILLLSLVRRMINLPRAASIS